MHRPKLGVHDETRRNREHPMPGKESHITTSRKQPTKNRMDRTTSGMPKILPTKPIGEVDHHNGTPGTSSGCGSGQPGRPSPDHHDVTPHG
jgi:hypothetical protein